MLPLDLTCDELEMLRGVLHAVRRASGHPGVEPAEQDVWFEGKVLQYQRGLATAEHGHALARAAEALRPWWER